MSPHPLPATRRLPAARRALLAAIAGLGFASPAAAITIARADLECFPGPFGDACLTDQLFFGPEPVPGRSRVTLATDGVRIGASASFQAIYRWATYDPNGEQIGGNNSIGAVGSFAYSPFTPAATYTSGFVTGLRPGRFSLTFTSDVPRNTDRCPEFLATAAPGSTCSERFQRLFVGQNELVFWNPPERFELSITASAVPEPATWATLIGGLSLTGLTARRRRPAPLKQPRPWMGPESYKPDRQELRDGAVSEERVFSRTTAATPALPEAAK